MEKSHLPCLCFRTRPKYRKECTSQALYARHVWPSTLGIFSAFTMIVRIVLNTSGRTVARQLGILCATWRKPHVHQCLQEFPQMQSPGCWGHVTVVATPLGISAQSVEETGLNPNYHWPHRNLFQMQWNNEHLWRTESRPHSLCLRPYVRLRTKAVYTVFEEHALIQRLRSCWQVSFVSLFTSCFG
jgi:hypothetical protein